MRNKILLLQLISIYSISLIAMQNNTNTPANAMVIFDETKQTRRYYDPQVALIPVSDTQIAAIMSMPYPSEYFNPHPIISSEPSPRTFPLYNNPINPRIVVSAPNTPQPLQRSQLAYKEQPKNNAVHYFKPKEHQGSLKFKTKLSGIKMLYSNSCNPKCVSKELTNNTKIKIVLTQGVINTITLQNLPSCPSVVRFNVPSENIKPNDQLELFLEGKHFFLYNSSRTTKKSLLALPKYNTSKHIGSKEHINSFKKTIRIFNQNLPFIKVENCALQNPISDEYPESKIHTSTTVTVKPNRLIKVISQCSQDSPEIINAVCIISIPGMALQKIKIWLNDSYMDDNRVFCLAENPELGLITLSKKQKPNDPDELSLGNVFTKNHFTTI